MIDFLITAIIFVLAIVIHEFSHAKIADKLGDPTPRLAGRLTLNPLAHLDPLGTILIFLAGFGWGKPVPFDPFNLKSPKSDSALISIAGPLSNIAMAIVISIILRILINLPTTVSGTFFLDFYLRKAVRLNILLAVFNLLPVHPLDGFKVVAGFLPKKYYNDWLELEKYGFIFLLLLIFPFFGTSPVISIISPIINFLTALFLPERFSAVI